MQLAAVFFTLAALGGLTILVMRLKGVPWPPLWLALGHGVVAATGLGLLGYEAYDKGVPPLAQYALGAFVLAALGGATLLVMFHLKRRPLPVPLILGHGLIALVGLALLLTSLYGSP
jgi:hypothetical protein